MSIPTEVVCEFYVIVKCLNTGFEFINNDDDGAADVYPSIERAFKVLRNSECVYDLEVAKVQILRKTL